MIIIIFFIKETNLPFLVDTYSVSLHSLDELDDMDCVIDEYDVERNGHGSVITLYIASLPTKRLWEFTLLAYGCQNATILLSPGQQLSKSINIKLKVAV